MVRAIGEEKFGGHQTNELMSHQQLTRAGLWSALALPLAVPVCLLQLCHAWFFLYEKSFPQIRHMICVNRNHTEWIKIICASFISCYNKISTNQSSPVLQYYWGFLLVNNWKNKQYKNKPKDLLPDDRLALLRYPGVPLPLDTCEMWIWCAAN